MKKFVARRSACSTDLEQVAFDDLPTAVRWLGDCQTTMGTIYRMSSHKAIYQLERGKLNFDRRMKKEREGGR